MDLLQYLIAPYEQRSQSDGQPSQEQNQQQPFSTAPVPAPAPIYPQPSPSQYGFTRGTPLVFRHPSQAMPPTPAAISPLANYATPSDVNQSLGVFGQHLQHEVQQQHGGPPLERAHLIQSLAAHPDILAALLKHGNVASEAGDPSATTSSTASDPTTQAHSEPQIDKPDAPALCFWWYHYGDCHADPQSPTYKGSARHCRYLHHIDAGMEHVKLQDFPHYWHKTFDCGLDRCPLSSTYGQTKDLRCSTARYPSSLNYAQSHVPMQSGRRLSNGGDKGKNLQVAGVHPAAAFVSSSLSQKGKKKHKKRAQKSLANLSSTPAASSTSLKRKASILGDTPADKAPSKKSKAKQKKQKESAKAAAALRYFDVIVADSSEPCKEVKAGEGRESCFFWYHGTCKKSGEECDRMHALTEPPSFIQPPPGYKHKDECFREWCPGDWMWDHYDQSIGIGEKTEELNAEESENESAHSAGQVDEEWYVQGFADA